MPRSIVRARSHVESPYLGLFLFARLPVRLPCWRTILAYLGFGHAYQPSINNSSGNSNSSNQRGKNTCRRRTPRVRGRSTGTRWTGSSLSKTSEQDGPERAFAAAFSSWASNSEAEIRRRRHAGRYWRFVQVVRRLGRRRVQKYDDRRPNADHRAERPRECQEGFQFRLAQGRTEEKGPANRGSPRERLDRLKVMPYTILWPGKNRSADRGDGRRTRCFASVFSLFLDLGPSSLFVVSAARVMHATLTRRWDFTHDLSLLRLFLCHCTSIREDYF